MIKFKKTDFWSQNILCTNKSFKIKQNLQISRWSILTYDDKISRVKNIMHFIRLSGRIRGEIAFTVIFISSNSIFMQVIKHTKAVETSVLVSYVCGNSTFKPVHIQQHLRRPKGGPKTGTSICWGKSLLK